MCARYHPDATNHSDANNNSTLSTQPARRNSLRRLFRKLRSSRSQSSSSSDASADTVADDVRVMGPRDTIVTSIESGGADLSPRERRAAARRTGFRASM